MPAPIVPRRPVPPMRMVVPRILEKAKIVIEVPLGELDERELLQAVQWLYGRNALVLVDTSIIARMKRRLREAVARVRAYLSRLTRRRPKVIEAKRWP
jgi:hypothetical protein